MESTKYLLFYYQTAVMFILYLSTHLTLYILKMSVPSVLYRRLTQPKRPVIDDCILFFRLVQTCFAIDLVLVDCNYNTIIIFGLSNLRVS